MKQEALESSEKQSGEQLQGALMFIWGRQGKMTRSGRRNCLRGIFYLAAEFPTGAYKHCMELDMDGNTTPEQRSRKGNSGPAAFLSNLFQRLETLEVQGAWGKRKRSPVWLIQPQVIESITWHGYPAEYIWRPRGTTSREVPQDTLGWLTTFFMGHPLLNGSSGHLKDYPMSPLSLRDALNNSEKPGW